MGRRGVWTAALAGALIALPALALPSSAQAARPMTTVVVEMSGCEGCTIGVQRALTVPTTITPPKPIYWNGPTAKVRGGKATLRVPTAYTAGMSFTIDAPWAGSTDAVSNIVTRYAGKEAGQPVSRSFAARAKKATSCWAGTTRSKVTLHVRADRFAGRDMSGDRATMIRPYFTPALRTVGSLSPAPRGTQGNQEAFYC